MKPNTIASTRFRSLVVIWLTACGFVGFGAMTMAEWIDLTKWAFGIYAASEGARYGATAYRDKG